MVSGGKLSSALVSPRPQNAAILVTEYPLRIQVEATRKRPSPVPD